MAVFLPLLNLLVAIQIAQAHTLRTASGYRYLLLLLFMVACIACGAAYIFLP